MITSPDKYFENLAYLQDHNFPQQVTLNPDEDRIYEVNLSERTIIGPKLLSVETDHKAETVYFRVDRFFDYMDLARTACVVQYINAKGKSYYYAVPFYDCLSEIDNNKMLIPWNIDGTATIAPGTVKFNLRFYKIERDEFVYNLTTKVTSADVLHGMVPSSFDPEDYDLPKNGYLQLAEAIMELNERVSAKLYWLTPDTIEDEDVIDARDQEHQQAIENIFDEALNKKDKTLQEKDED